jgi:hypothetical protein
MTRDLWGIVEGEGIASDIDNPAICLIVHWMTQDKRAKLFWDEGRVR